MFKIIRHTKTEEHHQMTHRNGWSAWATKMVLGVTSAAVTRNTELLVREEQTFFCALYTNLKTRQMNSNNSAGKTGHKWKTANFKSPVGERVLQSRFARTI